MQACGFDSLVDYINVRTCVTWEGNVTIRREISISKYLIAFHTRVEGLLELVTICAFMEAQHLP